MIYTMKVNGTSFLIDAETTAEAVCCAANAYVESLADSPDQCVADLATMPMSIQTCNVSESEVIACPPEEIPVV